MSERIERQVKWGWKRGLPSLKLQQLNPSYLTPAGTLPDNYDPTGIFIPGDNKWMPCYDQKQLGSCTANMAAALVDFHLKQQKYPWEFTPSRLFIYYNTRAIEGTTDQDAGGTISDAIASIAQNGCCPEDGNSDWSWPYSDDSTTFKTKPKDVCYQDARLHVALQTQAVPQQSNAIKSLLVKDLPVGIGFTVYSSFMSQQVAETGIMPVPQFFEQVEGGHAVTVVGYLTNYKAGSQGVTDWAIVRNSWGSWARNGYFLMPWNQVLLNPQIASDFQTIMEVGFKKAA